ncbi:carboxylating nicotinate-nucleotide diphosphorylase [Peptoniphilus stercorisuis]|uniref:nicotinate-nucleotide diphosphorylase (carboxylating) n=1 Tax=Peptoniphilus stercorisuis TaxID=1436965 RepID=A0ABS4KE93_9FIRM|nr:carboxylating nicotinate-nucleotide diphosphorylase [Peptoniphilus stercorisuis]MBP2026083.1 nicotinate-nucleotide pyrophosphorylase (carboxylating) [Peptoniphilus stercorisuis]
MKELKNILIDPYIINAIKEDITFDDVSTSAVIGDEIAEVDLIVKEDGIIAGLDVFKRVFEILDEDIEIEFYKKDGDLVKNKEKIAKLKSKASVLLSGERVALNYLQRISGIATYTSMMIDKLKNTNIKLLDTRKTTPNMRIFEKYAVKVGGGYNHRYNLSDGVLLKDNHINAAGGVKEAIKMAREYAPFVRKIEVEVENLQMVKDALEENADIIMLDNMDFETLEKAINLIDKKAEIEVSGNITFENLENYASFNIDYISSGALTHSAKILDISMKNLKVLKE